MEKLQTPGGVIPPVSDTAPKTQRLIVLPNGRTIPDELARAFRDQVLRRAPELKRDRTYKLKKISGDAFWGLWTRTEVRLGGMYIAHLEATGQLPLELATCPHAVPKRYRLK